MSADLEKLLPCPFCGGDNVGVFGPVGWYRTYGISHSCRMFYSGTSEMAQGFPDKKTAIAAWNARSPDLARQVIALTAENAALRAKAEKLAEAVRHEREMVCQDLGMQIEASNAVEAALNALDTP